MTDEQRDDLPGRLPAAAAERLLARAAEIDAAGESSVPVAQLRRAAAEAGIGAGAFTAALAEARDVREERAPLWVRLCMLGVPDRAAAMGFYWLFVTGLCATPVAALTGFWARPHALVWMLFCAFALSTTGGAIRWLDRHGWDALE